MQGYVRNMASNMFSLFHSGAFHLHIVRLLRLNKQTEAEAVWPSESELLFVVVWTTCLVVLPVYAQAQRSGPRPSGILLWGLRGGRISTPGQRHTGDRAWCKAGDAWLWAGFLRCFWPYQAPAVSYRELPPEGSTWLLVGFAWGN